jgi:hypothetical protein
MLQAFSVNPDFPDLLLFCESYELVILNAVHRELEISEDGTI